MAGLSRCVLVDSIGCDELKATEDSRCTSRSTWQTSQAVSVLGEVSSQPFRVIRIFPRSSDRGYYLSYRGSDVMADPGSFWLGGDILRFSSMQSDARLAHH